MTPDIINAAQNLQQCRKHIRRFQDLMNLSREGNKALYHKAYKHRAQWIQSAFQAEQELIDAVMVAVFAPTPEPAQPAPQEEFNFMDAIKAQAAAFGLEILSVEVDGVQGPVDMVDDSGFAAQADRLFTDEIVRQIGDETKGQK